MNVEQAAGKIEAVIDGQCQQCCGDWVCEGAEKKQEGKQVNHVKPCKDAGDDRQDASIKGKEKSGIKIACNQSGKGISSTAVPKTSILAAMMPL